MHSPFGIDLNKIALGIAYNLSPVIFPTRRNNAHILPQNYCVKLQCAQDMHCIRVIYYCGYFARTISRLESENASVDFTGMRCLKLHFAM